jgi:hypothetical protein
MPTCCSAPFLRPLSVAPSPGWSIQPALHLDAVRGSSIPRSDRQSLGASYRLRRSTAQRYRMRRPTTASERPSWKNMVFADRLLLRNLDGRIGHGVVSHRAEVGQLRTFVNSPNWSCVRLLDYRNPPNTLRMNFCFRFLCFCISIFSSRTF